jgi:RHS repeat-associated protein
MNVRYPGQYYDTETGLHYNVMRYYHPGLGRYLQSDPIGLEGGVNTYGYALQNPVMYYDPSGNVPLAIIPIIWGGIGSGITWGTITPISQWLLLSALSIAITSSSSNLECDDCDSITQSIESLAIDVERRYEAMLIDEHGLFDSPQSDYGSWDGHVQKYLSVQSELRTQIAIAKSKGCPVSVSAESWSVEPPPKRPFSG